MITTAKPSYYVLNRQIYEQTDSPDVYRLVEKYGAAFSGPNMHREALERSGAKPCLTFGEARLEAR
jgi:hypothetical protein